YALENSFSNLTGFGCADATTEQVVRFTPQALASSSPTATTISQATYNGFVARWAGSSSFFRVSAAGDIFWVQTSVDCTSHQFIDDQVVGVTRHRTPQSLIYESPSPGAGSAASQGPL